MRRRAALTVVVLAALASRAAADPIVHLQSPSTVQTDGGTNLRLPPGYFLDEPTWKDRDTEFRRLQDAETRLRAENTSLVQSAQSSLTWRAGLIMFATGLAAGAITALILK